MKTNIFTSTLNNLKSLAAAGVLLGFSNAALAQANLIVNPGFSDGSQGWSTNCTIEINPETVYGGSVSSNKVAEIDIERCFSQDVTVSAGAIYDFSFKASRRQSGTPAKVGVTVTIIGVQSGTEYLRANKTYTNTTWYYTTENFSFNIPGNSTDTKVRVRFSNYITTGTYGTLIDDITLVLNAQSSVLPIRMISFTATAQNNKNLLQWVAANEERDGNYFIVERLSAASKFDSIGRVELKSTGNNYSFVDSRPLAGANKYRVKAVNKEVSFSYSTIAVVDSRVAASFSVYPNPAVATLNCVINSAEKISADVQVYNASGVMVLSRKVQLNAGANQLPINVASLHTGSFYLKIVDARGTSQVKAFLKG